MTHLLPASLQAPFRHEACSTLRMLKFLGWTALVIFLIGLLVVFGVIDLIA